MRIGVDASMLAYPKTGIGHYVFSLLKHMANKDPDISYYLYSHIPLEEFPEGQNIYARFASMQVKPFWMQCLLPKMLYGDNIDLFWGGNYTLPIRAKRQKKVVTVHDLAFMRCPETLPLKRNIHLKLGMPRYLKSADHVLAVSNNTAHDLECFYNYQSENITVVSHAAREIFFSVPDQVKSIETLKRYNLKKGYILFVGTVEPRKGIETLIKAFSFLSTKVGNYSKLVLIGSIGWKADRVLHLARSLPVKDNVLFLDYVNDEDLAVLYKNAFLFVYPSIYEGFGLPVLEAMASGIPVITSNCSSLYEVGGDAALYFEPGNANELAQVMEKVFLNTSLQNKMREKGIARAVKFSWDKAAYQTLGVFSKVMN